MRRHVLLIVCVVVVGCTSLDTREAVVPAPDRSIRYEVPDTTQVREVAPHDMEGAPTRPAHVAVYDSSELAAIIERLLVTTDSITIQTAEGDSTMEYTFLAPGPGEAFVAQGDTAGTDTTLKAEVEGTPRPDTIEVYQEKESDDPGFWEETERQLAWIGGLVVLGVFGFFASKFLPWI